jgi:heme O synthase-like polyprenyltransferase
LFNRINHFLVLVATTAAYGFVVAPLPISIPLLACVTLGTVLTSASANTVNQLMEIPYDAQMKRTRNRVLVLGQMRCMIYQNIYIKYFVFHI